MGGSDKEHTDPRYYGLELGVVVDNVDPKGLGRVRLTVPGIIDQPSPWAPQIGTLSGGSPQRGAFSVPKKGSDVGVLFHRGDPERPYYIGGHFGSPAGGDEVPEDAAAAPPNERHDIHAFDTKAWKVSLDDREGKERVFLSHKHLHLSLDLDAKKGTLEIRGETALSIKSDGLLSLDSPQIIIGGRTVVPNGRPIQ